MKRGEKRKKAGTEPSFYARKNSRRSGTRGAEVLNLGGTDRDMAANLYDLLRRAEKLADILIAVEPSVQGGVMAGVMNRLKKACASVDIPH